MSRHEGEGTVAEKIEVLIVLQKVINRKPLGSQNQILRFWQGARVGVVKIR